MMTIRTRLSAICAVLLLITASACTEVDSLDAADDAGSAVHYEITIPADDQRVALVRASLIPDDRVFYMFPGANQLPMRWSTFVSNFEVHDENNQGVPVTAGDDGTWRLSSLPQGRVAVTYQVSLDHENHAWDGGIDGAAYWNDSGVFYTARSLFVVNGDERENITVEFRLPDQWRVTAPWQEQSDDAARFSVPDHDVLATSMFFAGTHKEVSVRNGPFELLLALGGEEIMAQEEVFVAVAGGVLDYYVSG
jgi:predicted metalloprotease with PDZ domain